MATKKFPIRYVIKREGNRVPFERGRIKKAILKAGLATKEFGEKEAEELTVRVLERLLELFGKRESPPHVEEIQDVVEIELMRAGYLETAKAYILYRKERENIREQKKAILDGRTTKLDLSINSLKVLKKRYLQKDLETGKVIETPEEMFWRVARALANVEKQYGAKRSEVREWEKRFYEIMSSLRFLPAGRTLANAGAPTRVVSNCIVLHIEDSMESIFQTLKDAALLQQAGSGIGFPFHLLRPAGSIAKRTRGIASGPVSFLRVYDQAFRVIKQQGRHGANMAVMRVDHPDILEFIHCKEKEGELVTFNISVAVTDKFMEMVKKKSKEPWMCEFGGKRMYPRRVVRDSNGSVLEIKEERLTAEQLMMEIVSAAWLNGEPGIIFIDEVNRKNPLPGLGRIESCNPCGEQFLHDGDVCNLGSINLDKFVLPSKRIDWQGLKEVTRLAVRLLDNVIDITEFPTPRVNELFRRNRRVGLGVMGWADMLFQLEIPYNSPQARQLAEKIMRTINKTAHETSRQLAQEKGVFENWKKSVYYKRGIKMRNAALTSIAPTGSISMVADTSSGIEPWFSLAYYKVVTTGGEEKLLYVNKYLRAKLEELGLATDELWERIVEEGSLQNIEHLPSKIKRVFVGALDIKVEDHVLMQASFQKYVDNSISKTINFPNQASPSEVMKAYILGWETKCKSLTIYREGSREVEILKRVKREESNKKDSRDESSASKKCPQCENTMISEEGCWRCPSCGFGLCAL